MTYIEIDADSKTPPFEQIKASIIDLIGGGRLPEGHRLPPIRQLAGDLGVAPNTVARAYRELEADGLVRSRGRRGTVVLARPADVVVSAPEAEADAIEAAINAARSSGLDASEILQLVASALARP